MSQLNQLTKKNQEFINIATKQLLQDGKSDSEIKAILEEALPQILERQAAGETARHFLGAPTAWAASFSQPQVKETASREKNTNPYLMWLDMSLLLLAVFCLINAATLLFSKTPQPTKLVSLLVLTIFGGAALYFNYHFIYRHMGKDRSQRPNLFKSFLIMMATMSIWVLSTATTAFLPDHINMALPLPALIIMSLISFAARHLLKRKYNIQNALQPANK